MQQQLFTSIEAAAKLGISPNQFRRIIKTTDIKPAKYYTNRHYRTGPKCPLWASKDLNRLKRRKAVEEAIVRNSNRRSAEEIEREHLEKMEKEYGSWQNAIKDAAQALFELNRYCKHDSCSRDNKDEIYDLKGRFLGLLCECGYLVDVREHIHKRADGVCYRCEGRGGNCPKCFGDGVFHRADLRFLAFGFLIDGTPFCWHQPAERVTWQYEQIKDDRAESPWSVCRASKPVSLTAARRTSAKKLIKFVLEASLESLQES